jgi:TatD DNase family protein
MNVLPPLDTHAHVSADIPASDLERLGAVIFIPTRSLSEFRKVSGRKDVVSIWGLGCHPGLVGAQREFDAAAFAAALSMTPYVAEIGLDAKSRVPIETQLRTLRTILDLVEATPRILSLHSYGATELLAAELAEREAIAAPVLHWWLGSEMETARALALGCYFSLNYSMIRFGDTWRRIPTDRILLETDHPAGDRFSAMPRQPGRVQDVEKALAAHHKMNVSEVRLQIWKNFASVISQTNTFDVLPLPVRRMVESVR